MEKPWFKAAELQRRIQNALEQQVKKCAPPEQQPSLAQKKMVEGFIEGAQFLDEAVPFWVSPEMSTLVLHSAKTMPGEPLLETDVPTPVGFVYLDVPGFQFLGTPECRILYWRAGDRGVEIGWPSWHEARDVNYWTAHFLDSTSWGSKTSGSDWGEESPEPTREDWEKICREGYPGGKYSPFMPGDEARLMWVDAAKDHYGRTPSENEAFEFWQTQMFDRRATYVRQLKAFWSLASQRLAIEEAEAPPRAIRRERQRAGKPPANDIRVIHLRRPPGEGGGNGGPVAWSHRWMVSGHWRNQWRPSVETHRLTWIAPHVKGPQDKPLVVRKNLYVVAR